ncbi:MAG TPA: ABC transporter permease [Planctomycetota bacterium]|nr:ABC transporter permease [Planctomycetota bacterium]
MRTLLSILGARTIALLDYVGGLGCLFAAGIWWMTVGPWKQKGRLRRAEAFYQMERLGLKSFGIVSLVIFFVGIILAFQMAYVLKALGVTVYVANITGVAMMREMAPLLVAMVMAGFNGAAIAAEIGTMVVDEEVTALETSALHPVRFLVVPRVLAAMVMMPFVTLIATYIGIFGGFAVGNLLLDIEAEKYLSRTLESLKHKDLIAGLVKAEAFGILVALIACQEGMRVTGGAQGVGRATTNAVVRAIVAIIVCDMLFTAFFFYFL